MRPTKEEDEKLKLRNFRMNDPDYKLLEEYFSKKGIGTSTGVRMVLIELLRNEGLRKGNI